jgi:hypothetical protein
MSWGVQFFQPSAHPGDLGFEGFAGEGFDLTTEEFLSAGFDEGGQPFDFLISCSKELLLHLLVFGVMEFADLRSALAAPGDERGLRDAELNADATETPASGAEFEEFGSGFGGVHINKAKG